jgi:hypothetical protein
MVGLQFTVLVSTLLITPCFTTLSTKPQSSVNIIQFTVLVSTPVLY